MVQIQTGNNPLMNQQGSLLQGVAGGGGGGTLVGSNLTIGPGKISALSAGEYMATRNRTEAFIRIEQAANGKLVQVAKKEGDQFTTWLCKDGDDLIETIKQALADMKV